MNKCCNFKKKKANAGSIYFEAALALFMPD